ncbi:site-specific integrase [Sediminibacterium soli]|uniref:site-specific integrase n=1 Tax=Sediminibacterium soli TaxID=2698829 RepID=UPI00137A1020|nr:site-specific integrase [Sediminibacterium soli]NCI45668.1 tyrosine-type recombinase/integrase [Sediminibacterium soli]
MSKYGLSLQNGSEMGQKNFKGAVSVTNADGRIRLRWRYSGQRYSINLSAYSRQHLQQAKKTALEIEQDIAKEDFDFTLSRYKGIPEPVRETPSEKSFVEYFEEWTSVYKQMDCDKHTNYNAVRNMLRKWGKVNPSNIHLKLNKETFCAGTYNRRLTMLKGFVKWLVKAKIWQYNALEDINPKRSKKVRQAKRRPFNENEISRILEAVKNDTFCPVSSVHKHSHYYPFLYFIFKTGVRNAEAIGLRVGSINAKAKTITIKEALARSLKGTSSSQRIRKETKNGKERVLPLTDDLALILLPLIADTEPERLVFLSPNGVAIDDHNFQRRIFKRVLEKLNIEERVLYACRHTFGSRCIDAGITPVMTAFLMGNNPETALRNYTHQLNIPKDLPSL